MAPARKESWFYPRASINDLTSVVFWRDVACELLAVTILMTFVTLVLISNNEKAYQVTTTHLGIFAVVAVYLLIEGYGPMSAHMNPAASLSFFVAGKISFARALIYIIVQTAGSAAGSGLGLLMTPANKVNSFHAFDPENHGMTVTQGLLMEAFFAFNLVFVAISVHDTTNRSPAIQPALAIACCIGIGIIVAGTHTGGLMNPIIPFGPAILAKNFKNHWLYWVGPLTGGPLGVLVYKLFIYIKVKFGPKPQAESRAETAVTKDELIAMLDKLLKQQESTSTV